VRVVPNGVNPEHFPGALEKPLRHADDAPFTVGFVGSMKPWHGLANLLEGFTLLHDAVLAAVVAGGNGPGREQLAAQAAARGWQSRFNSPGQLRPRLCPRSSRPWMSERSLSETAKFLFFTAKVFEYPPWPPVSRWWPAASGNWPN